MCIGGGGGGGDNGAALAQQRQIAAQQAQQTQELSDKQIQAQKEIADQQAALNEKQFAAQQEQYAQQQTQADEQAQRQSEYDAGRAQVLGEGTQQVSDAFSRFSPDYFNKYAQDYMAKAQDQIDYQKRQALKDLAFATARQGISSSQANVNQLGLIDETAGRATAEQTANAQQAAASLQANTADARQNLLSQVAASTNIGSPIAGRTIEDVGNALQTQKSAVSGITSNAGDTVASLQAVPNPGTLGTLFSGVLGAGGSLLGGIQAGNVRTAVNRGLAGTSPSGGGSTRFS
jgi:hypothetical protein